MKVLVIAPHPDDETLGCGGTMLVHRDRGDSVHWLIVTAVDEARFGAERVASRDSEIKAAAAQLGVTAVKRLDFPTAQLDQLSDGELIGALGTVMADIEPDVVYVPWGGDAHSDHRIVFDAAMACTKWFRYPSVRAVLAYETLSETDQGISADELVFQPNYFVDIAATLASKLEIMQIYASELGKFPFPRSAEAIEALAKVRGAQSGFTAAESFMILRMRGAFSLD